MPYMFNSPKMPNKDMYKYLSLKYILLKILNKYLSLIITSAKRIENKYILLKILIALI